MPGFVPDDELVYLYSRAYALVQPSLMEGFGLPAVEAMACGTPVVSSRAGSLPEVVGEAGLFFDPTDVASIASTIRRDPRRSPTSLTTLSASHSSSLFNPDPAAATLVDCFGELGPRLRGGQQRRWAHKFIDQKAAPADLDPEYFDVLTLEEGGDVGIGLELPESLRPSKRASLILAAAWSRSRVRTFSPAWGMGVFP